MAILSVTSHTSFIYLLPFIASANENRVLSLDNHHNYTEILEFQRIPEYRHKHSLEVTCTLSLASTFIDHMLTVDIQSFILQKIVDVCL